MTLRRQRGPALRSLGEAGRRVALAILSLFVLCLYAQQPLTSQNRAQPTRFQVEAAYLADFVPFVSWPSSAGGSGPLTICVLGNNPVADALPTLVAGTTAHHRPLTARTVSSVQDAAGCHVLFLASALSPQLPALLDALRHAPVLTVSDIPGFTARGGMIGFVLRSGRVRFQVNLDAARQAHLALSSQLLKVAASIRGQPRVTTK